MADPIRPFRPEDIPAIVALRTRVFQRTTWPSATDLAEYFHRIFFGNPWGDQGCPSLVYLDGVGAPVGFLGAVVRPAVLEGRPARIAVGTQFMVDPAFRGLAAIGLLRRFLAGPQDLSLADVANDASRTLWEGLGGSVSLVQSFEWSQVLRPIAHRLDAVDTAAWGRIVVRGLRAASRPVDRWVARRDPVPGIRVEPLTPAAMSTAAPKVLAAAALRPDYGAAAWLVKQLGTKKELGPLHGAMLSDVEGGPIGWVLWAERSGGVAEVVQLAARKGRQPEVLAQFRHEAWRQGFNALRGRLEPDLLPYMRHDGARLHRAGPWVLHHTSRPDVRTVLRRGEAFLSRLEGEWWMSF
ncbi:MAG: GNAT family N-acetyltransferase [Gemmatimonadales bacterium]